MDREKKIKIGAGIALIVLFVLGAFLIARNSKNPSVAIVAKSVKDLSLKKTNLVPTNDSSSSQGSTAGSTTTSTSTKSGTVGSISFTSASELHSICEAKTQPLEIFACYKEAFQSFMQANANSDGGKKTMYLLDDLQKLGGYAQSECHPLAHKVGNIAFHVYGSVLAAVPQYVPVCASGYYHGLLEEYLATAPNYYEGIKVVCGTTSGSGSSDYFNWFQCTHGLGHGVMEHDADEVPRSLKDCDVLDPANQAREICYAGVFMENITTDEKTGRASKYIKPEDPIYPCDIVETQYKSACYFLSSSQILKINHWNFQDAFNVCDTKAEKAYRWLCYESLGRDVSGSSLRDKTRVNTLCMMGSADMRGECFFGAVRDFINDKGTFDTAVDLCNSVPSDYTAKCYSGVLLDLSLYQKGQQYLNTCATMAEPYKTRCTEAVKY
jgi:hypothetical protein